MTPFKKIAAAMACAAALSACAQTPMGPHIAAMPEAGKPFEAFAGEQTACTSYAQQQVSGQADTANVRALAATILGAGLGAGLGAATGGAYGAGIGAAAGGAAGLGVGAFSSDQAQHGIQTQYDNAYAACMAAKGNSVGAAAPAAVSKLTAPLFVSPTSPVLQPATPVFAPPGAILAPPPPGYYYLQVR